VLSPSGIRMPASSRAARSRDIAASRCMVASSDTSSGVDNFLGVDVDKGHLCKSGSVEAISIEHGTLAGTVISRNKPLPLQAAAFPLGSRGADPCPCRDPRYLVYARSGTDSWVFRPSDLSPALATE
jgi:hypothetical protein